MIYNMSKKLHLNRELRYNKFSSYICLIQVYHHL